MLHFLEEGQRQFMMRISEEQISLRKSELYLGYILYTREVINRYQMVKLLQKELENGINPNMHHRQEVEAVEPIRPSER